jgi:hypothetical protein
MPKRSQTLAASKLRKRVKARTSLFSLTLVPISPNPRVAKQRRARKFTWQIVDENDLWHTSVAAVRYVRGPEGIIIELVEQIG